VSDAEEPGAPAPEDEHHGHRSAVAAARARTEAARARIEDGRRRLEGARARSTRVDLGFRLYERDRAAIGNILAGALAFRLFFVLVPFVFFVLAVSGLVSGLNTDGGSGTARALGLRGLLADAVNQSAHHGALYKWVLLIGAAWASAYAASKAVRVLVAVHAAVWGVTVPRPSAIRGTRAFLGAVILGFGVSALAGAVRHVSVLLGILATLLVFVVYFGIWLSASAGLPHASRSRRSLAPGAILVAAGFEVLHLITVYVLAARAEHAQSVYGALGVAVVTLVWLFIIARLLVGSALLNATLWDRRRAAAGRRAS
jgi:uncharacterized BrkB/YihY/UPF0761 family membrane protein